MKNKENEARPSTLARYFDGPGARAIALGLLMLVLLIPQGMIESRVNQRAQLQSEVSRDIARSWGGHQQIIGPLLRVPYEQALVSTQDDKAIESLRRGRVLISADTADTEIELKSDVLHRGIFEVPVYRSRVKMEGKFLVPDPDALPVRAESMDWSRAELWVGLSDPASLSEAGPTTVDGSPAFISVGQIAGGLRGIQIQLDSGATRSLENGEISFEMDWAFNGSGSFMVLPTGAETRVSMTSNWPHPAFSGAGLPTTRDVTPEGFSATWELSRFASSTPTAWKEGELDLAASARFGQGVSLISPVDPYRMGARIAKYGALVILLSFALIWMTELMGAKKLHPIQYLMIGSSLCLFGLLQLALAEHIGFGPAYAIAALAVAFQAAWYAFISMNSFGRASLLGLFLCGWFAYLYLVLGSEDVAFLLGSIALFAALTAAMWATRRMNRDPGQAGEWEIADATLD